MRNLFTLRKNFALFKNDTKKNFSFLSNLRDFINKTLLVNAKEDVVFETPPPQEKRKTKKSVSQEKYENYIKEGNKDYLLDLESKDYLLQEEERSKFYIIC